MLLLTFTVSCCLNWVSQGILHFEFIHDIFGNPALVEEGKVDADANTLDEPW